MPQTDIPRRLEKLRASMEKESLDAVLITKFENRIYYSGFTGSNGALIISLDKAFLITDGRYFEQSRREAPHFELVKAKQSYEEALIKAIRELADSHPIGRRIGFEASVISVATYGMLTTTFKDIEFIPCDGVIGDARMIKEPAEIEIIRKAVHIAESAFRQIESLFVEGATERELAAEFQYRMKLAGADKEAFDVIVASGENGALPHAGITDRRLKSGDSIVVDWGAKVENYNSDMTRTLFVGDPPEKIKKIYEIVLNAQKKVLDVLRPGMTTGEADAIARDYIVSEGYGEFYMHGLGHGIGLAVHEEPRVKSGETTKILPGMVFTVEPGIYLPGEGGVRIEDLVVITDDGCEILTSLPK